MAKRLKPRHVAALALLLVSGCSYETVYMKNPATGQIAACGPYRVWDIGGMVREKAERGCIEAYQQQGFVRISVSPRLGR